MLSIAVCNQQNALRIDAARLKKAARAVLRDAGITGGSLSIAVVDDLAIRELNKKYLAHDYATDVLSFALARNGSRLEGEVIASAETAARVAGRFGWAPGDELLLYVIHGTLHLVGYDDRTAKARARMQAAQRRYLAAFGLEMRDEPKRRRASKR
jgi:probable rRNA maturation factor